MALHPTGPGRARGSRVSNGPARSLKNGACQERRLEARETAAGRTRSPVDPQERPLKARDRAHPWEAVNIEWESGYPNLLS